MGAPLGNKYAVGNNGGCPPIYKTPQELVEACDAYFEFIKGEFEERDQEVFDDKKGVFKVEKVKEWIRYPEPPTVTGLTLFLGFASRSSLDDYEKRNNEFSYIIKRARSIVEHGYEMRLHGDKPVGAIFALKNMNWKDRTEVITTDGTGDLTPEEKKELDELLSKAREAGLNP